MNWKLILSDLRRLPTLVRMGSALRQATTGTDRTLAALSRRRAQAHPERIALRFEDETVTYGALDKGSNRFAHVLAHSGIGRDPFAIMMQNSPALLMAQTAAAKTGAVAALINTHIADRALAHALQVSGARHVFADGACLPRLLEASRASELTIWASGEASGLPAGVQSLDQALAAASETEAKGLEVSGHDVFLYIYTSGTTGYPKPAIIRHSRFAMAGIALGALFGIGPEDVIYAPLPLYHGESNFVGFSVAMSAGAAFASRRRFHAAEFWPDVRRHQATMFVYVGELCRYLLAQPASADDRNHRLRLAAGAGLRPQLWSAFQQRFGLDRIVEMYGMTEGNVNLMNLEGRVGSIGKPHPFQHRNLKLARYDFARGELERDGQGHLVECAIGEAGEALGRIATGGYMPYEGYRDRSATEARVVRNAFRAGDAWFRTGDLLRKDDDGFYYFVDRLGDTFRWKGENVATLEVEAAIGAADGIVDASVYGVTIPGCEGRAGAAALVLSPGLSFDGEGFYRHVEGVLPPYARPAFVRIVEAIATTGTLKQRKLELQQQGYDRGVIRDPIYVRDDEQRFYVPLSDERIRQIEAGTVRL